MRFSPIVHRRHTAGTIATNPLRLRMTGAGLLHASEPKADVLTPARKARGYETGEEYLVRDRLNIL